MNGSVSTKHNFSSGDYYFMKKVPKSSISQKKKYSLYKLSKMDNKMTELKSLKFISKAPGRKYCASRFMQNMHNIYNLWREM